MRDPHILYGGPVSLYTGRARSYLRKQRIDFVEVSPGSDRYLNHVVPAVGRWIIPVVETPDGELIQDGAAIIEHFENRGTTRHPAFPGSPVHLAVSHVFDLFGAEGLLRPAMHYRWNFDEQNVDFLRSEFSLLTPAADEATAAQMFDHNSGRMRRAAVAFGVTPETTATIEASFDEWLDVFSAHLVDQPYLLGDRPTLGDYGLMAAMWAHLFRDPAPTALIKKRAPRVGRWVERMSTSEPNVSEYHRPFDAPAELFADDSVPDTLIAMLRFVADEYLAEITAHVDFANEWLAERPELETGTNGLKRPGDRGIGSVEFEWRGIPITTGVMPYRFWLMQRIHDAVGSFDDAGQAAVRSAFTAAGLDPLLDLRTDRRVERVDNLEVWGPTVDTHG